MPYLIHILSAWQVWHILKRIKPQLLLESCLTSIRLIFLPLVNESKVFQEG